MAFVLSCVLIVGWGGIAQAQNVENLEAFTGQSVIIPVEEPDFVSIDRRDVVDYVQNLPPTELRPVLTAQARGTARVTVTKDDVTTIYEVLVRDPNAIDQTALIKRIVGDPALEVVFLQNNRIVLEGQMTNDLTYRRALQVASAFSPDVLDFMTVKNPSQIRIKSQVLEVNVTKSKEIGMQYSTGVNVDAGLRGNPGAGGGGIPLNVFTMGTAPFFEAVNALGGADFGAVMNLAQDLDVVKVLQEPTLTVLNGQPAIFRVGGEIPIITTTVDDGVVTEDIEYRPFGISLIVTPLLEEAVSLNEFYAGTEESGPNQTLGQRYTENIPLLNRPTIFENGIIKLFVRPEISDLGSQRFGANQVPDFVTRYVESRVALKDGQPLVIGGLYDEESRRRLQEVPFISKIPILGELFKSRRNTDDRLELVFVITPEIIGFEEVDTNLADYNVRESELEKWMLDKEIPRMPVKPTRISANDILVRGGDAVPAPMVRDLRMMESPEVLPMTGPDQAAPTIQFAPERQGPTIQDFENDLPDEPQTDSTDEESEEPASTVQPSQGLPDLQPRPSE